MVVTIAIMAIFSWVYITALNELPSVDSGPNFFVTIIMVLVLLILASFVSLTVSVDGKYLRIKFGYGIFSKSFKTGEIASVKIVKNSWYHGWGIHVWFSPYMWVYNVSGFDAVEVTMKNGRIYRIGTNDPRNLETAIKNVLI